MNASDFVKSLTTEVLGGPQPVAEKAEKERIQKKQGGHHMPPEPNDGPALDDTDRNTDKVIKPNENKRPL